MANARNTRKANRGSARGIVGYLYNPIRQSIRAVNNTARAVTRTTGKVVHNTLSGLDNVGHKVSGRADAVIKGLVPRSIIRRITRRNKKNQKSRKNQKKNRKD